VIANRSGARNPVSEQSRLAIRRRMYESVRRLLSIHAPGAIIAMRRDDVLVLAVERDGEPFHQAARNLADTLVRRLRNSFPHSAPVVGIGGVCRRLDDIAHSYEQARHAARAASSLGRADRAVGFEELGILRLLLQVPDLRELNKFADDVFGRLLQYDRQKRTGLLRTLSAYLKSNGSLQAAGKSLHLHPNSIAYRLGRIRDLLGLDLDRYDDRLLIQVALAIVESLEPEMLSGGGRR
jgi:DNA-binding PucR family transcriptional regulator